jgi:hypothetical protein
MCIICVLCLIAVPLPLDKTPFAVKKNKNNNNNNNKWAHTDHPDFETAIFGPFVWF